jgi:hypothetical protein
MVLQLGRCRTTIPRLKRRRRLANRLWSGIRSTYEGGTVVDLFGQIRADYDSMISRCRCVMIGELSSIAWLCGHSSSAGVLRESDTPVQERFKVSRMQPLFVG